MSVDRKTVQKGGHHEAIWDWVREGVTANTYFGTAAAVREHVGRFFRDVAEHADEVTQRCRTALQTKAAALALAGPHTPTHVVPTLASV